MAKYFDFVNILFRNRFSILYKINPLDKIKHPVFSFLFLKYDADNQPLCKEKIFRPMFLVFTKG